ncbi:DinB family protein [uncultured Maribacter sp.]|uniref:DinB family protein n=1 Tax=uncultured Maribacter sp. TaxID=431308 RepID=UPI00260C7FEA|nr:DinB family protein [uncultured Maribacter sp.]
MKKLIIPFILFSLLAFNVAPDTISKAERKFGVAELEKTQKHLKNTIKNLSEEQINFKPTKESWSIAECLEHITISENTFSEMLTGSLKTPADPTKRGDVTMSDDKLLAFITTRDTKVKTSKSFEPSGKYGSYEETLTNFNSKRKENIKFIKKTKEDLRNHYGKLPFATIDGFQILIFMSGHTERHVKQMKEIKSHKDFPKN